LAKSLEAVAFTRHQDNIMPFTHLDIGGPVATLSLDHRGGNRINFDMRVELREAVQRVEKSPARALLIRGEGRDFCLRGDVRDWPGVPTEVLRPKIQVFAEALDHLERLSLPTITAVQGGCMGGGFELALSCDLIIAAKSAHFAFPEARLGIVTLQAGMMQIAERVDRAKAAEIVFFSEPTTAEQMRQWNVVNRVVEDTDLESEAAALAVLLASRCRFSRLRTRRQPCATPPRRSMRASLSRRQPLSGGKPGPP
jgi:enoyl-CoA hydratase/carnithine racemase